MTTKAELLRKIRFNCSECMGAGRARYLDNIPNYIDIRDCTDTDCIFFEFRFGRDPKPNPRKIEMGRKLSRLAQQGDGE